MIFELAGRTTINGDDCVVYISRIVLYIIEYNLIILYNINDRWPRDQRQSQEVHPTVIYRMVFKLFFIGTSKKIYNIDSVDTAGVQEETKKSYIF